MKTSKVYQAGFFGTLVLSVPLLFIAACLKLGTEGEALDGTAKLQGKTVIENDHQRIVEFLELAIENNERELRLAELAQQKGATADVKELGRIIERSRSRTMDKLREIALNESVSIPIVPQESWFRKYRNLLNESGDDFDRICTDMLVDENRAVVRLFENARVEIEDEKISDWALTALPLLRKNLDSSLTCQKKSQNM